MFDKTLCAAIQNAELAKLITQAECLARDHAKNKTALIALLKRIAPLAKAERDQLLYVCTLRELIYYEKSYAALYYAELFFRAAAQYLAITKYPSLAALRKIANTFHNAYRICYRFAQVDDAKMEIFWSAFREACEKGGLMVLYWMSQTDLALIYQDLDAAKHAAQQLAKQPYDYHCCYACRKQSAMGTYLLQGDLSSCVKLAQQILNRQMPPKFITQAVYCSRMTLTGLYNDLIDFASWFGSCEALHYFLPPFVEACHAEHICDNTTLCYCHAVSGDFTHLDEDLAYMVTIEMEKNAEERARWSAWNTTITSLTWVAYMKKLLQCDIDKIALPSLPEDLSFPSQDGQYLVQPLLEWWETRADDAGHTFEASRAKFHYQNLKENFLRLCGV